MKSDNEQILDWLHNLCVCVIAHEFQTLRCLVSENAIIINFPNFRLTAIIVFSKKNFYYVHFVF